MNYVPQLDGIRGVAVLVVLLFHTRTPLFSSGFFGVDVFFVLSGFLITSLLVTEWTTTGTIDVPRFYLRRLRRLLPALLAFLVVYLIVASIGLLPAYPFELHLRDALLSALYVQDYAITLDMQPLVLRHMWSLSVEEHFYLVWPLVLLMALRLPRQGVIASVGLLFVAVTIWRFVVANQLFEPWHVYHRFDTHCSGLLLGGMAAIIAPRIAWYWGWIGIAGLVWAMSAYSHSELLTVSFGFTIAEISAALVVVAPPALLSWRFLAWMGRMSYGLYLWHYLIVRVMRPHDFSWYEEAAYSLVGGLALAAASYYLLERRIHRSSVDAGAFTTRDALLRMPASTRSRESSP